MSEILTRKIHTQNSKRHPGRNSIGMTELFTRCGLASLQLISAYLAAACNDTVGGSGGQPREQTNMGYKFQGYYCQIDVRANQYTGKCDWIADNGDKCPPEYVDNHVLSTDIHWRLQSDKDQYGNEYPKCVVTVKQN